MESLNKYVVMIIFNTVMVSSCPQNSHNSEAERQKTNNALIQGQEKTMNKITRIGLDIAKNIFVLHAVNEHGKTVKRKTLDRSKLLAFFAQIQPCLVGIKSCASSPTGQRYLHIF